MLEWHDMFYPPHGADRRLHVWLPDDYHAPGNGERYPVTYFFDGQNLFRDEDATYGTCWGLADFLRSWEKPMIVVGMECSHVGDQRLDEYCPYDATIMGHEVHGMGEETFRWILDDVKPWVDERYRTWPHREATAIAGSSMGGIMSCYGVIAHNDAFGKAACVSPGLRRSGRRLMPELERADIDPDTRVYVCWGEHESGRRWGRGRPLYDSAEARAAWQFAGALDERGATTYVWCVEGGEHNEATWATQNRRCFDFLWLDRRDGQTE